VLLVIFIITTPQLMNNLEINLPSGKPPAQQTPKPKPARIYVNARGQVSLDDTRVTLAELKTRLAQMKAANPEIGVVIKGDDAVDYQNMVNVLDILHQLDISKMGLATE
jgi:biopolymer transport protein ExbD